MGKPKVEKNMKTKRFNKANSYFALKSKNEVYYQMASIFKAVTHNEDKLTKKILTKILSKNSSEIYLESLL